MDKLKLEQAGRALFICIIGLFIYIVASSIAVLIYPFMIAFLLAFVLHPIIDKIEQITKLPRGLIIFLCMLASFSFISALLFLIAIELIQGTVFLKKHLPHSIELLTEKSIHFFDQTVLPIYEQILYYFNQLSDSQQSTVLQHFSNFTTSLSEIITKGLETILSLISTLFFIIPNSLVIFIFILLGTYFLLIDWERLQKQSKQFVPKRVFPAITHVLSYLKQALFGFIRAQLLIVLITGVLILIGLLLLKVKHAVTISLFAIALDLLPYIGTGVLFLPWIIYLLATGQVTLAIGILSLYIVIIIIRQFIEPKILATNIGLHPLVLLITIFVALQIWGVFGLLLGPILLVCINACMEAGVIKMIFHYIRDGHIS